jgi:hypothetical protein
MRHGFSGRFDYRWPFKARRGSERRRVNG